MITEVIDRSSSGVGALEPVVNDRNLMLTRPIITDVL